MPKVQTFFLIHNDFFRVCRLAHIQVEILEAELGHTTSDVQQNIMVEYISCLCTTEVLGRHTTLFIVMYYLVDLGMLLRGNQLLAQVSELGLVCRLVRT